MTASTAGQSALPRLLYIGDVSVANTFAGEALLYRLLRFYPADKLGVICGVRPGMRVLPGVSYHHWGPMVPRLLHSRVGEEYCLWRAWRYYQVPKPIAQIAASFRPQAILTISHVSGWLAAWRLAAQRSIPFHLIAHDDYVFASRFPAWARSWAERKFAAAYRAADSRFCISDTMAESYARRYGAPGLVMYPTRDPENPVHLHVAARTLHPATSLTFAYAGSINSEPDCRQILAFARIAGALGHRLLVYSPQHAHLSALSLRESAFLEVRAPVVSGDLVGRLREEADCLFLPQAHGVDEQALVSTAFPTKWADYSSVGLPILAWAPVGASITRFLREHPGCAELATDASAEAVRSAIQRVAGSPDHRRRLTEAVINVGRDCFAPEAAWERFRLVLASRRSLQ